MLAQFELLQHVIKLRCFFGEFDGRGRRVMGMRRIFLRDLIDLLQASADFTNACGLVGGRLSNIAYQVGDFHGAGGNLLE